MHLLVSVQAFALLLAPMSCGQTVYSEQRTPESLTRSVMVGPTDFTKEWLEGYCRDFISNTTSYRIRKLWVSTEHVGRPSLASGSGVDNDYNLWRRSRDKLYPNFGVAELLAIETHSVLRVREPNGAVSVKVLQPPDMLHQAIVGAEYEILDVAIRRLPIVKSGDQERTLVEFFVQTPANLEEGVAKRITEHIQNVFRFPYISVRVCNDSLFMTALGFPLVFPFGPLRPPPSAEEFSDAGGCYCSGELKIVRCSCINTAMK
jgi:hypothetical protein